MAEISQLLLPCRAVLVRNPFDRILHIHPYFLEEQQQFVSTTNLLNWLCKKNALCIMRERSSHIQIINFNEWPISTAESAPNFTPHNSSPHYRHFPTLYICHTPPQPHAGRNAVCKQCNDCAIAALLLSLTLVGLVLAVCSAGHAYHWLRKRLSVCASVVYVCVRVNALLAQHCWQRRSIAVAVAACIFIREEAVSSKQRQHCSYLCLCWYWCTLCMRVRAHISPYQHF